MESLNIKPYNYYSYINSKKNKSSLYNTRLKNNLSNQSPSRKHANTELFEKDFTDINNSKEKEDIMNIISPKLDRIHLKEESLNKMLEETNNLQEEFINKKQELLEINKEIEDKKARLVQVYHSLFDFKEKLLKKEKELNEKEDNLKEYENILNNNENILKSNIENFNNYMQTKSDELKKQFEQVKILTEQKELELKIREEKIEQLFDFLNQKNIEECGMVQIFNGDKSNKGIEDMIRNNYLENEGMQNNNYNAYNINHNTAP